MTFKELRDKYLDTFRQAEVHKRIERHEKANENYIDQGIRLLELARNTAEFYRDHGQEDRAVLLKFILQGSTLQNGMVAPVFKPPFDIIHGLAEDARAADKKAATGGSANSPDIKKQAASAEATCLFRLPRTD